MRLKKGDLVTITKGKERGKKGKILRILTEENRVVVEGANYVQIFLRPSQQNPKGGIARVEGKLSRANVQLVCPRCSKPTRGGYQALADKTKHRICKRCNEII